MNLSLKYLLYKIVSNLNNESDNGYCKFPDGTLIQWGSVVVPQGSYVAYAPLSIPFIDKTKLGVSLTCVDTFVQATVNYTSSTVSSLQIGRTPNTTANTFYYIAMGRWK